MDSEKTFELLADSISKINGKAGNAAKSAVKREESRDCREGQ